MTELTAALFAISDCNTTLTARERDTIHNAAVVCEMVGEARMPPDRARLHNSEPLGTLGWALNMYDELSGMKDRLTEACNDAAATTTGGE